MTARLPRILRRRAEQRRVDEFLAAIRRSGVCCDGCAGAPAPRPVVEDDTVLVPRLILLAAVPLV